MATVAKIVYSHVTKQPGVRGGKACIDDTRISVADIVALLKQGVGDRQIIERYPSLNLAQVHAAISRLTWPRIATPRTSTNAERPST